MHNDTTPVPTVEDATCLQCGQQMPRRDREAWSKYRRRKFCSRDHHQDYYGARDENGRKIHFTPDQAALLTDVRELLGVDTVYGFPPQPADVIARRLNTTTEALGKRLSDWGYLELARPFWAARGQQRRASARRTDTVQAA